MGSSFVFKSNLTCSYLEVLLDARCSTGKEEKLYKTLLHLSFFFLHPVTPLQALKTSSFLSSFSFSSPLFSYVSSIFLASFLFFSCSSSFLPLLHSFITPLFSPSFLSILSIPPVLLSSSSFFSSSPSFSTVLNLVASLNPQPFPHPINS